jgi:hypothetical protein
VKGRRLVRISNVILVGALTLPAVVIGVRPAHADTPGVHLTILASDPAPPVMLQPREGLYVRVDYESAQPLLINARGYLRGQEAQARMSNASQLHPAGRGEALAWVAYEDGGSIDEIRVNAYDERWRPLTHVSAPVNARWSAQAPARGERAAWVQELSAAQAAAISARARSAESAPGGFWSALVMFLGWSVPGYIVLQIVAWRRLDGGWRKAAMLPLILMVPVFAYSLFALFAGSNLWPIFLLFACPPGLLYLAGVFGWRWMRRDTA